MAFNLFDFSFEEPGELTKLQFEQSFGGTKVPVKSFTDIARPTTTSIEKPFAPKPPTTTPVPKIIKEKIDKKAVEQATYDIRRGMPMSEFDRLYPELSSQKKVFEQYAYDVKAGMPVSEEAKVYPELFKKDFTTAENLATGFATTLPSSIADTTKAITDPVAQGLDILGAFKQYLPGYERQIDSIIEAAKKVSPLPKRPEFLSKLGEVPSKLSPIIEQAAMEKGYDPSSTAATVGKVGAYLAPAIIPIGGAGVKGVKNVAKSIDVPSSFNEMAGNISTKANRFIGQKPTEDFIRMTGQTPGQFAVSRGMTKVGDEALEEATNFFRQSMDEADKAFAAIPNKVRPMGKDVVAPMLDDLAERLVYVDSPDASRISLYKTRYDAGDGLTMSEINDIKRTYSQNFKYTFADNVSKDALRSKNLQDNLREWQFTKAKELGLSNIDEINKNTQAWRAFSDNLAKSLSRTAGNNQFTLTDWISLSGGEPTNLALFLGKKALESKTIKQGLIKTLGKKTKEPIIKASNLSKNGNSSSVLPSRSNIGNKSVVKPKATPKATPKNPLDFSKNKKGMINPKAIGESMGIGKKVSELENAGVKIEDGIAIVYRGANVSPSKIKQLRYNDYLSSVKSGKDISGNEGASGYGKNVIELKIPVKDLKVENGEIKYVGESKSISSGKKYPQEIYRAYNDFHGSNFTAKEIDAMSLSEVRNAASRTLRGGEKEFDKLIKK